MRTFPHAPILSSLVLFTSVFAQAGTQTSEVVEIHQIQVRTAQSPSDDQGESVRLRVIGVNSETSEPVKTSVARTGVVGSFGSGQVCAKYKCYGSFALNRATGELNINVERDQNQDGDIDGRFQVKLGQVLQDGTLSLETASDLKVELLSVHDRYSIVEKLMGQKDADFFSMTIVGAN